MNCHDLDIITRTSSPIHRRARGTCLGCNYRITWAEQRRQFGRMLRRGLTPEQAKSVSPRCQKCMTVALRGIPKGTPDHE